MPFEQLAPAFYIVTRTDGSSIAARRVKDGSDMYRDASQFKLANSLVEDDDKEWKPETDSDQEKWREIAILSANPELDPEGETAPQNEDSKRSNCNQDKSKPPELISSPTSTRPKRTRRKPVYYGDYTT